MILTGKCFVDDELFSFFPERVVTVPIDPETDLPPDMGGDPSRVINRPICSRHIAMTNAKRVRDGRPEMPVFHDSTMAQAQ